MLKLRNLVRSQNVGERIATLAELRVCGVIDRYFDSLKAAIDLQDFRLQIRESMPELADLLAPEAAAETAFQQVSARFLSLTRGLRLPFPAYFNADASFGMLCYALARMVRPTTVLEVGVGYGTSSALLLRALTENGCGRLISLDLPPLGDYRGAYTGLVVPDEVRHRWILHKQTGSRKGLRKELRQCSPVHLFIGDGGSVSSLQRFEVSSIWPHLGAGGWAIINNTGARFSKWARQLPGAKTFDVWQTQKVGCVTTLIHKLLAA